MEREEVKKLFLDSSDLYDIPIGTSIISKEAFESLIDKIYDDFERKIDNQISYLEDLGWYEFDDKKQAIESMYELKGML